MKILLTLTVFVSLTCGSFVARAQTDAASLLDDGKYEETIKAAGTVLSSTPDDIPNLLILARALIQTGNIQGARDAYGRAASLSGDENLTAAAEQGRTELKYGERGAAFKQLGDVYRRWQQRPDGAPDPGTHELVAVGRAVAELAKSDAELNNVALGIFERAIQADPDNPEAHVAIGELLLSRNNNTEALEAFRDAIKINPVYAPALLGIANSQYFDRSTSSIEAVRACLDSRPNYVQARVLLARIQTDLENYDIAIKEIDRALAINPNSPEALTLLSAIEYLQGDRSASQKTRQRVRNFAPGYVEMYETISEIVAQNRHYADAAKFAAVGVNMDPATAWRSYSLLGINRLRMGDTRSARAALERSFGGDPYDVRTKNTLDLMDRLDSEFTSTDSQRFTLVADNDEEPLLAPKVFPLVEAAYDRMAERYGYRPRRPIRIEMYPDHADFSVRTIGLTGVDIIGVSFGPVVALDSPSAGTVGEFNWGSVLWHEIAHTFHLGMSGQRVPRWFTEGLAVFEERRARDGWGDGVTPSFLQAFKAGKLNPPSRLNESFLRPSYPEQITHAYFQASLLMELINDKFGFDAIKQFLIGYKDGSTTEELVAEILQMSNDDLDSAFELYVEEHFGDSIKAITDESARGYTGLMREARESLDAGDIAEAEAALLEAQRIYPHFGGERGTYRMLAEIYEQSDRTDAAIEQLEANLLHNAGDFSGYTKLAELYEKRGEFKQAAHTLEDVLYVNPFVPEVYLELARLHGRIGNWPAVAQARSSIVTLGSADPIEARYLFAQALAKMGDTAGAKREVLATLEQAPLYEEALDLLLEMREATGESRTDESESDNKLPATGNSADG